MSSISSNTAEVVAACCQQVVHEHEALVHCIEPGCTSPVCHMDCMGISDSSEHHLRDHFVCDQCRDRAKMTRFVGDIMKRNRAHEMEMLQHPALLYTSFFHQRSTRVQRKPQQIHTPEASFSSSSSSGKKKKQQKQKKQSKRPATDCAAADDDLPLKKHKGFHGLSVETTSPDWEPSMDTVAISATTPKLLSYPDVVQQAASAATCLADLLSLKRKVETEAEKPVVKQQPPLLSPLRMTGVQMLEKRLVGVLVEPQAALEFARALEEEMCSSTKNNDTMYRTSIRSMCSNLAFEHNKQRIASGELTPSKIAALSDAELASPSLQQMRQQIQEQAIREHTLPANAAINDAASAVLRRHENALLHGAATVC